MPAEDPNPDSVGIYVHTYDWLECFDGVENDVDEDGIGDACEFALAQAFAPLMNFSDDDYVAREPKWAARKLASDRVLLLYLPAYYKDNGVQGNTLACATQPFCDAHFGDSESIALIVEYNSNTEHWILKRGFLSQHGYQDSVGTVTDPYVTDSQYADRVGGYPTVYVAYSKHANYRSDASCDAGGVFALDDCKSGLSPARLEVYGNANLGGYGNEFIDCVYSGNPSLSSFQECFWTGSDFGGWQNTNPTSGPYSDILEHFEFIP